MKPDPNTFHSWLAFHNRLSTRNRMISWNIGANGSCVLCQGSLETRNHTLTASIPRRCGGILVCKLLASNYNTDWDRIQELLKATSQDKIHLFLLWYAFEISLHSIWRERNNRRHEEPSKTPTQLARNMDKQIRNRLSSIREMGDKRFEGAMEAWFGSR